MVRVAQEDAARFFSLQAYVEAAREERRQRERLFLSGEYLPVEQQRMRMQQQQQQQQQQPRLAVFNSCGELNC